MRLIAFFAVFLPLVALAGPQPNQGYGQVLEPAAAPTSLVGTAVGTCADGAVMLDVNGVIRCGADTTTDPSDMIVRGGACYELDATCTAPDMILAGGIDTKQYTGITQANCGTDTITVTVVDNAGTSTASALVEGTDWDCLTDDNTCATALAAAIDAVTGVSAQSSTNTVGVRPDDTTMAVTVASSDATCATAADGTDGIIQVVGDVRVDDDQQVRFGTGADYWQVYNSSGTQFELWSTSVDGGGTDGAVIEIPDGADNVVMNGSLTIGAVTKDATLTIENDSGVTLDMSSSGSLNPVVRLPGAGRIKTPADGGLLFGLSGVDGRMSIVTGDEGDYTNYEASGTIDPLDGFVDIVGGLTVSEGRSIGTILIDCDDDQYTVPATAEVIIADTDVGSCTGNLDILLPAAACAPATQGACRIIRVKNIGATSLNVDPNGTEEIDNNGAGTAVVVTAGSSLTIIDANQTDYHWIIE